MLPITYDKSLDLLGSDPNIEREQRAKQQYFTYWLLETCKDKTRLVTKCFNEVLFITFTSGQTTNFMS
jgi:hypothetical protein